MSVMERRMRELGAMSSSASSRRAIVVAQGRLAQSQDVEEARQSQEIAGMNANDFVEKLARPWHGLTSPRLSGANPPPGSLSPCTPPGNPPSVTRDVQMSAGIFPVPTTSSEAAAMVELSSGSSDD